MSRHTTLLCVAVIGLLHLVLGIAGIAVGGTNAQAGWFLVVIGLVLVTFAWRDLRGRPESA